jgi:hypothetical protein
MVTELAMDCAAPIRDKRGTSQRQSNQNSEPWAESPSSSARQEIAKLANSPTYKAGSSVNSRAFLGIRDQATNQQIQPENCARHPSTHALANRNPRAQT